MSDDAGTQTIIEERHSQEHAASAAAAPEEGPLDEVPLTARPRSADRPAAGPSTRRDEADPLPSKRGEIGYREPVLPAETPGSEPAALPARHPADRDHPQPSTLNDTGAAPAGAEAGNAADSSSVHSDRSTVHLLLTKLKPKKVPTVHGILLTSLLVFVVQILIFMATIAGWALLTMHLVSSKHNSSSSSNTNNAGDGSDPVNTMDTTQILLHVAFGIVTLAQLVFAERSIYHMRAQRWVHVHGPGLPMPGSSRGGRRTSTPGIGFAPWNRPPLPTYAAALAQSGVGTGDVEDNAIAIAPPPAYGNTRGSTLVLSGVLTDAMREQKARARAEAIARANARGSGSEEVRGSWASVESRPMSYMSRDEEWEERQDARRAVVLEETLARLDSRRPA